MGACLQSTSQVAAESAAAGTTPAYRFLIVGGGTAAGYICKELVAQGVAPGAVGIVTDEPVAPYERPALTKAYLHPPTAQVRARLPGFHTCVGSGGERQTEEWYKENGIAFLRGKATGVNLAAKELNVNGTFYKYDKMIIATGSRPSRLTVPGAGSDGASAPSNVHYLRKEEDGANLVASVEKLSSGAQVVVIGAGFIGLESAAALVGWEFQVTIVMPGEGLLRQFPEQFGAFLEKEYKARGVKFMKGEMVESLEVANGVCGAVKLKSGARLPCDLVVAGIGGRPNVEWCQGLKMEKGGFAVDGSMQTSDTNVYAVGDVCTFPSQYGGMHRLEFVDHARKSAEQAARAVAGLTPEPYKYLPYFYSRVFEYTDAPIVFNCFGDLGGERTAEELGEKKVGAIWVKNGKLVGCMMMGSPGPTAEDAAKLKQMAIQQQEVAGGVIAAFQGAGL